MFYNTVAALCEAAKKAGKPISEIVMKSRAIDTEISMEDLMSKMDENWQVMLDAMDRGLYTDVKSVTGLSGGDAKKIYEANKDRISYVGSPVITAMARAIAVAEVNAAMGRIVAAPTAGACGVLPAVLFAVAAELDLPRKRIVKALFAASGVGLIIAQNASLSGAEGGCQAECGSASCMAAFAAVELAGGTPEQAMHAGAIALKNMLGLVCDPVAGLVEVPCIKRNASSAANAMIAFEMALANVESKIPIDEVIVAMKQIGDMMSPQLKETACGGLAVTPTGRAITKKIFGTSDRLPVVTFEDLG